MCYLSLISFPNTLKFIALPAATGTLPGTATLLQHALGAGSFVPDYQPSSQETVTRGLACSGMRAGHGLQCDALPQLRCNRVARRMPQRWDLQDQAGRPCHAVGCAAALRNA